MKCLVCGKNYEGAECPRCHFPDIQIVGDREKGLESMMPMIRQYREDFLRSVTISLVLYRWKDVNGTLVVDQQSQKLLGTGTALMLQETWLEEKLARIPDQKTVNATICIALDQEQRMVNVPIPNLQKAELQQLGIHIDSDYRVRLMLRNSIEAPTASDPIPLFTA